MANADAQATYWNTEQYHGVLLTMGAKETPFLNAIGGAGGMARYKVAKDWKFAMSSQNELDAESQSSITETASLTAPTERNYDRSQEYNVCQILQKTVGASYAAQSALEALSGIYLAENLADVNDPMVSNLQMTLLQSAREIEYHVLNGTYNLAANAGQAMQTRGITSAISTNAVDAGADALTTADFDAMILLLKETSFAPLKNPVLCCRYSVKKKLCDLYGVSPFATPTNNIGTISGAIDTIVTEAGKFPIMEVDQVAAATILLIDMAACSPVFLPKPERNGNPGGIMFLEPLSKTGAADRLQLYSQYGLDYGSEKLHGKITNFT